MCRWLSIALVMRTKILRIFYKVLYGLSPANVFNLFLYLQPLTPNLSLFYVFQLYLFSLAPRSPFVSFHPHLILEQGSSSHSRRPRRPPLSHSKSNSFGIIHFQRVVTTLQSAYLSLSLCIPWHDYLINVYLPHYILGLIFAYHLVLTTNSGPGI